MSLLTSENALTRGTDSLAEFVTSRVDAWEVKRDNEHRARWMEYYRLWKGIWSAQDVDRASERCRAIMPAIAQAVDSAVAEMEEATFGRLRWFDVASDDDETGRQVADLALKDLDDAKAGVSAAALWGAVYGTGVAKIVVNEDASVSLVAIEPFDFAIDPAATTIDEAFGCAHIMRHVPAHLVYERQRQGIYAKVDPGLGADYDDRGRKLDELSITDTDHIDLVEWHGLAPREMIPRSSSDGRKLKHEEHAMVESIVTVANKSTVLKAVENPFVDGDRSFVSYQHSAVPGRFWGRGVVEMGYWPQKVLDAEIRNRVDALGFSTHPMMAINSAAVPRGGNFSVRPGRNVFLNGAISDNIAPLQFPPPDPQTYRQSAEMERMVEMATGQLQASTSPGINAKNDTASGMSMIMGASIRRTKRAMANRDRSFLRPLISKSVSRLQQFDVRYPQGGFEFEVFGTLGIMAREFEQAQLGQLLNAMGPGPEQLLILRQIVENSTMVDKEFVIEVLTMRLQQELQPQEPPRDLGGEARMLSAQTRQMEVESNAQIERARLELEQMKVQLSADDSAKVHERGIMELSIDADRVDADEVKKEADAILSLSKASAEEGGAELAEIKAMIEQLQREPTAPADNGQALGEDAIALLRAEIEEMRAGMDAPREDRDIEPIRIERDTDGLIKNVNGRAVQRDGNGLIAELI